MRLESKRLFLRRWKVEDARTLYSYAKDPDVGPIAGWPVHTSEEESQDVILHVLSGAECYAVCEKESGRPVGAIELKLCGHTDLTDRADECELGFWIGKPYWGRGYVIEAAKILLDHGFYTLGMTTIWCGYYDGNEKSKKAQEKIGFCYHHSCEDVPVPLLKEVRIGHTNYMTREHWEKIHSK